MKLRHVFVLILATMLFASCTFFQPAPTVCDKPEAVESKICFLTMKLGLTPEKADLLLRLASSAALDANPDEAEKALTYLNEVLSYLNTDGLTYALFSKYLNKGSPSAFLNIVGTELLSEMERVTALINQFDLNLLKIHFTKQRDMVQASLARSK